MVPSYYKSSFASCLTEYRQHSHQLLTICSFLLLNFMSIYWITYFTSNTAFFNFDRSTFLKQGGFGKSSLANSSMSSCKMATCSWLQSLSLILPTMTLNWSKRSSLCSSSVLSLLSLLSLALPFPLLPVSFMVGVLVSPRFSLLLLTAISLCISSISTADNYPFVFIALAWHANRCSVISQMPSSLHIAIILLRYPLLSGLLLI